MVWCMWGMSLAARIVTEATSQTCIIRIRHLYSPVTEIAVFSSGAWQRHFHLASIFLFFTAGLRDDQTAICNFPLFLYFSLTLRHDVVLYKTATSLCFHITVVRGELLKYYRQCSQFYFTLAKHTHFTARREKTKRLPHIDITILLLHICIYFFFVNWWGRHGQPSSFSYKSLT